MGKHYCFLNLVTRCLDEISYLKGEVWVVHDFDPSTGVVEKKANLSVQGQTELYRKLQAI